MSDPTAGPWRARAQTIVLVAVVVSLICGVFVVINSVKLSRDNSASGGSAGTGALSAGATTALAEGGQIAVDFTSFDYRHLEQSFRQTAIHATPAFAKVYLAQSRSVASLIRKAKAVSISQVVATGLQSFTPSTHTATVLVAVNDTTKNIKSPAGTVVYLRMQVKMVDENGQWLATLVSPQ